MPDKQVTGTQAIDRACDLLIRVISSADALTLSELVEQTGLAKGTASRMCSALERSGLLGRSRNGGFVVGPLLNQFAVLGGSFAPIVEKFSPVLAQIAQATEEDANIAVPGHNGDILCIAQANGHRLLSTRNWVGDPVPSHCTSVGKILLAWGLCQMPTIMKPYTEFTITDVAALQHELQITRQRGYAVARSEYEIGLVAVAVPIWNEQGDVIGAISITGNSERISHDDEARLAKSMLTLIAAQKSSLGVA